VSNRDIEKAIAYECSYRERGGCGWDEQLISYGKRRVDLWTAVRVSGGAAVDQYNPGFDLVPNRHDAVREVFPYGAGGASVRSSASSMGNGTS